MIMMWCLMIPVLLQNRTGDLDHLLYQSDHAEGRDELSDTNTHRRGSPLAKTRLVI